MEEQKKEIEKISKEFNKIKNKKPGHKEKEILMTLLTGILGIYKKENDDLIKEMINYAKKNQIGIQGQIINYNKIRNTLQ